MVRYNNRPYFFNLLSTERSLPKTCQHNYDSLICQKAKFDFSQGFWWRISHYFFLKKPIPSILPFAFNVALNSYFYRMFLSRKKYFSRNKANFPNKNQVHSPRGFRRRNVCVGGQTENQLQRCRPWLTLTCNVQWFHDKENKGVG